jgi:energy-coupling factor transport system ATP-binding protein
MSIEFKEVSYVYAPDTPLAHVGLDKVSFKLAEGKFYAVVGHTGSGKSTLLQHFNALLKPTAGEVHIAGYTITPETTNKGLLELRRHVGIVFQFPESQLFESTVEKDIAFGPKNFGLEDPMGAAHRWLNRVGLPESIAKRSPFELSGGQMRRVAIAGIMASEPDVLCLDEPAAGLDPQAKEEMLTLFKEYQQAGHTVILISHDMDDVARLADVVLVMQKGRLIRQATPAELFQDTSWDKENTLARPQATDLADRLKRSGFAFDQLPLTVPELAKQLAGQLRSKS